MLRFGSGIYNVRESEIVRHDHHDKLLRRTICCTVHFLDDTREDFELEHRTLGQDLLDRVFRHLELIEKDYFGLQYDDVIPKSENLCWLDPAQSVRKQLRCPPYVLYLRVKFYVADPCKLYEEYTRYHFYLQLRKDIHEGKLHCSDSSAALLGSYAVQSEYGDYVAEEHGETYLDGFQFLPNQTASLIKKIADLHKLHRGQTPADAEYNFLDHAKRLEAYGIYTFKAQDCNFAEIHLGAASFGVAVFQKWQRINVFCWSKILEISFKRKQFFLRLNAAPSSDGDASESLLVGFKLASTLACKLLWKSCVEHHTFFRLVAPPVPPTKGLFRLGSRFRYSGRTEYQTVEEMKRRARIERTFHRAYSKMSFVRSSLNFQQTLSSNFPAHSTPMYRGSVARRCSAVNNNNNGTCSPATLHHSLQNGTVQKTAATGSKSDVSVGDGGSSAATVRRLVPATLYHQNQLTNGHTPKETTFGLAADDWADESHFSLPIAPIMLPPASDFPAQNGLAANHNRRFLKRASAVAASNVDDGLVTIRMKPDGQGRFGFNVKGGADLNYPIIVSRVVAGSQADQCLPRLNEGDQVLVINGRDVTHFSHDQVVRFIRSFKESSNQELVLTVRPNAYIGEDLADDSDQQAVPQSARVAAYVPRSNLLNQSIILLRDSINAGSAAREFEKLYRRKPGMQTTVCLLSKNLNKNRYRDILPYDSTRVVLKDGDSGSDYINANFVNMEIPATGIVNRYIAGQGPLAHTCSDFWTVVWEQVCPTIVMLTALNERGRSKCHQYWPDPGQTLLYTNLAVKCALEKEVDYGTYREFVVVCNRTGEERCVSQLQYSRWPDHGVPDDLDLFVKFMVQVRLSRAGMVEPVLVHCSAGIGRTGVLILMETAMCLIEANEPVYPLDVVKIMRDQRAMLIQTPVQYLFACESICQAYDEGIVKPLAEYYQKDRRSISAAPKVNGEPNNCLSP